MQTHFRREMTISHKDFMRLLPDALGTLPHTVDGTDIVAGDAGKRVEIRLAPEGERDLGSLELPVTCVDMDFSGYSQTEMDRFFERFDRYYRREGGG